MKFLIGADPELFIKNTKSGQYVCAYGHLPGTKAEPFKVERGAVQVDGFAFEYNIDPAETAEEFVRNNETVMKQMREIVHDRMGKEFELDAIPYATFDSAYFKSVPKEAKVLGCDPDFNTTGGINNYPAIQNYAFRTAAGHLHIGWTKDEDIKDPAHFEDCKFVSNHFVNYYRSFSPKHTKEETQRLNYYGYNGSFRPKSYGVELRMFSNLWTKSKNEQERIFNFAMRRMSEIGK